MYSCTVSTIRIKQSTAGKKHLYALISFIVASQYGDALIFFVARFTLLYSFCSVVQSAYVPDILVT